MSRLKLNLLGTLQASVAGTPLSFPTDKVRALLAYLAVEQGRPHRREVLAALLWPDQPDANARRNLRLTLHRLKQAVDTAAPDGPKLSDKLLTTSRSTVQWETDVADVDYTEFVALLTLAEKHSHSRLASCPDCLQRLETAVSLLHGDMLAGLSLDDAPPFEEWLLVQREFIHHRALRLFAALADVYAARNDHIRALTYARRQLALEPWYEAAHRQAMRALALSGDRDRALAQYETCRTVLWQELGVEPAAETAVLHQQIRENRLSARPQTPPLHHIPADLTPFIGRSEELTTITNELADPTCRLLTLVGPGGIGKTRLAIQAARQFAAGAPPNCSAVYFVPLAAAAALPAAVTILAANLGVALSGSGDPQQEVVQYLQAQSWLLVLDNLEQLPNAAALVSAMLQEAPQMQILATSRTPLRLRTERRLPLAGLPCTKNLSANGTPPAPAVALFVQSARQMVPGFRLDAAAETAVVELCRLVDGLPLALELAAGWVRVMDCAAILREAKQNLAFLSTSLHEVPQRHRSLHAIFNQTWTMLPHRLRHLLAQAAHFPGDFTLAALQGILPATTMLDVATLLDKSLLRRTDDNHYELHPLLKQFAVAQVPQEPAWQQAFSRYYLQEVARQETELFGPAPQLALQQVRRSLTNLRQAWLWGVAHQLWAEVGAALPALSRFYQMEGLFAEAVTGIEETLPALDTGQETAVLRCRLHLQHAHFLGQQGEYETAVAQAETALALAQQLNNNELQAQGYSLIGEWRRHQGRYAEAEQVLTTAITLLGHLPGPHLAAAHNEIGFTHLGRGNYAAARTAFRTAQALYEELGDRSGTAVTLGNLGYVAQLHSDYDTARNFLQQALQMAQEIGDRQSIVKHTLGLGWVSLQQGDMVQAQAHQQEALRAATAIGYLRGILTAQRHIADAQVYQNKLDEAESGYRRLLAQAQRARLRDLVAHATGNLGIVHARRGEYDAAIRQYEAAIELCRELDDSVTMRKHLGNLGSTYRRLGQYEAAERCFTQTLQIERLAGLRLGEANTLINLGAVCRQQGRHRLARAYFEAALALYEQTGHKDGIAKGHGFLGLLHLHQGEFEAAAGRLATALAISEALGDRLTAAVWQLNLGEVHAESGEWETAVSHLEQALQTFRELNSRQYITAVLQLKARTLLHQDRPAAAKLAIDESVALAQAIGEDKIIFEGRVLQAKILATLGRADAAATQLNDLLAGAPQPARRADVHYELWQMDGEIEHAKAALALYKQLAAETPDYRYRRRLAELSAVIAPEW